MSKLFAHEISASKWASKGILLVSYRIYHPNIPVRANDMVIRGYDFARLKGYDLTRFYTDHQQTLDNENKSGK